MDCVATHSCRDFVDYDANTIAVAHNVTTEAEAHAVLHRIDTGIQRCTAAQGGGPQWVSEIYYGKADTTHGNIGDSASAMGRIAWFDAKDRSPRPCGPTLTFVRNTAPQARVNIRDQKGFDTQLERMVNDLILYTWMHERYGCDGTMQRNRTAAYFEYPSTIAMLIREALAPYVPAYWTSPMQELSCVPTLMTLCPPAIDSVWHLDWLHISDG